MNDCVSFNHDGQAYIGLITKLNHKTASLIARDNKRWRVDYALLSKVIDGEQADKMMGVLCYQSE